MWNWAEHVGVVAAGFVGFGSLCFGVVGAVRHVVEIRKLRAERRAAVLAASSVIIAPTPEEIWRYGVLKHIKRGSSLLLITVGIGLLGTMMTRGRGGVGERGGGEPQIVHLTIISEPPGAEVMVMLRDGTRKYSSTTPFGLDVALKDVVLIRVDKEGYELKDLEERQLEELWQDRNQHNEFLHVTLRKKEPITAPAPTELPGNRKRAYTKKSAGFEDL